MWQLIKKVGAGLLLALVMQVTAAQEEIAKQVELINTTVEKLYGQGKHAEAMVQAERAVELGESGLGVDHPITGTSLNQLALLHQTLGAFDKALPLYQRSLEIAEKANGVDHPVTSLRLNNLASLHEAMGAYAKALPLYQRALAIAEKALGPEHPETGKYLNNLAGLHRAMGAYDKALPLFQRTLAIAEKTLGAEHPTTGTRLNNLAVLHFGMGMLDKALPFSQRALAITEKVQGPEHPSTGISLNNLAGLYQAMGAYDNALPLLQRALAITEKAQGPEHLATATRLNNLALLYRVMGGYENALPLYQRSLAILEKTRGREHVATGTSLNNLAMLHKAMGAYEMALPLFQRALAIAEKAEGAEHPSTSNRLMNLAGLHQDMGSFEKALSLYQRALSIAEKTLGPEHPATVASLSNLAAQHSSTGSYEKALSLYQRAFGIVVCCAFTDPELFATVTRNLCEIKQITSRQEAIFYCKLAVNTRQAQRLATKKLPGDLQQSYAKKTENAYLLLSRLLNQANRNTEAAQVLRALKEVEFSEFISGQVIAKSQVDLTSSEANLNNLLRESAAKLQPLLTKQDALRKAKAGQAELAKLDHPISIAKKHLYEAFEQIPVLLKSSDEEAKAQFKVDDNIFVKHLANLNAATQGEKNAIIVITVSNEHTQISTFYKREPLQLDLPIAKGKLAQLVAAMQAGIVAKTDAWRAPARELHALLIAPVEAQFAATKFTPQNLSFVISGEELAIPPLAALQDANGQFLASKYRFSLYNPRSGGDVLQDWEQNWDIIAFGSTKGEPSEKLMALPQVANELANIVRGEKTPQGVLPGEKYLDQQFTRQAWAQSIANNPSSTKRRVLHVATHFKIDTNHYQSKLLMGDGNFYSAAEIAAEPGLPLSPVDLVTLSACDTLQKKSGKGSTFEGLGALFQYKGASAVLGTLWAVADGSTAELMKNFYTNRGEQRKMSKAQALQAAQQKMIESKGKNNDWSHPYYWSGFVLMGNWL